MCSIWDYTELIIYLFSKDFIYLFLERGDSGEKERERNIDAREKQQSVASPKRPDWVPNRHPGRCTDCESIQWPFTFEPNTQPTEPHWSGLELFLCFVFRP